MGIGISKSHWAKEAPPRSKNRSEVNESDRPHLPDADEEIPILPRQRREGGTEYAEPGFHCRKTESEMGDRCDGVCPFRTEALPIAGAGSVQQ